MLGHKMLLSVPIVLLLNGCGGYVGTDTVSMTFNAKQVKAPFDLRSDGRIWLQERTLRCNTPAELMLQGNTISPPTGGGIRGFWSLPAGYNATLSFVCGDGATNSLKLPSSGSSAYVTGWCHAGNGGTLILSVLGSLRER